MLYGDGSCERDWYQFMVPQQYGVGTLGLNIGKLVGGVVKSIPGVGTAVDTATALLPGGGGNVPDCATGAGAQGVRLELARNIMGPIYQGRMPDATALQRLDFLASGADPVTRDCPSVLQEARAAAAAVADFRARGTSAGGGSGPYDLPPSNAPGVPTQTMTAGVPSWLVPVGLAVAGGFVVSRFLANN